MAEIVLDGITKRYPDGALAVHDFNLTIADGEFVILVGPSGCGKSTTLNMIAGLEDITEGTLRIDGRVVNDRAPKDRDIAMVFQSYALYPHMNVRDNMGFALRLAKTDKAVVNAKVEEAARILDLTQHLDRKPANLSGGQRQRVAMGRAIVRDPKAFLMDEPLSNLDAKLRVQMRTQIAALQRRLGTTTVYVTHDQVEAMTLGDRVVVMRGGVVQQVGTPQDLYDGPVNLFVAGFIGSPGMNLLAATLEQGRLRPPRRSAARGPRPPATGAPGRAARAHRRHPARGLRGRRPRRRTARRPHLHRHRRRPGVRRLRRLRPLHRGGRPDRYSRTGRARGGLRPSRHRNAGPPDRRQAQPRHPGRRGQRARSVARRVPHPRLRPLHGHQSHPPRATGTVGPHRTGASARPTLSTAGTESEAVVGRRADETVSARMTRRTENPLIGPRAGWPGRRVGRLLFSACGWRWGQVEGW